MKCFYHSADLDGKCSAAIVRRRYPNCELIPIDYGQPFPWEDMEAITEANREPIEVIMVDFSLQPFSDMIRLDSLCDLTWIDHHKSAIGDSDEHHWIDSEDAIKAGPDGALLKSLTVLGIREVGIGACVLTWRYLFPDEPVPRAVQLLGEYDVGDHHLNPDCLPFQYGMRLVESDPENARWPMLFGDSKHKQHLDLTKDIIKSGRSILEYQTKHNEDRAKTLCFDTEMDGLRLIAANHPHNSKLLNSVWDPSRHDAMCIFYWKPSQWTIELYTDKPGLDLGAICKEHGGNGHPGAAGFQCAELPFELGEK